MIRGNANAAVAGGTSAVGVLVTWLLGLADVPLSAEEGALIAGGASTLLLWLGREGVRGLLQRVWRGAKP